MYSFSATTELAQAQRLRNVDLRLVVGYLKCVIRFILANPNGPRPFVVEGYRSNSAQGVRYAQGRTEPGPIITYAEPGQSKHNAQPSQALDIGFVDDQGKQTFSPQHYEQFYGFWKEHSTAIIWGGTFKKLTDRPHFEVGPLL
jgi:hypothetical protein